MTITITAFANSPDRGRGLARDMRVRWALEEVGQPYAVRYLSQGSQKAPSHRALQPFGQVPTYEEGDLTLFESGAIVLHIAEMYGRLLPADRAARSRAIEWAFAALNTVEPPIMDYAIATLFEADEHWSAPRLPAVERRIDQRLGELSVRLGASDWLDRDFSAGDLLMVSVLRILRHTDLNEVAGLLGDREIISLTDLPATFALTRAIRQLEGKPRPFRVAESLGDALRP